MKKFKTNAFLREFIFLLSFLFGIEMIFRVVGNLPLWDYSLLRIFCSCVFLSLGVELLLSFIKKETIRNIISFILLLIATIYAWVQTGFRNFLGIYMSVGTSTQAGAVVSYLKEFFASYKIEYYAIFLPVIFFLIYILFGKKEKDEYSKKKSRIIGGLSFISVGCLYALTLFLPFMQNPLQLVENYKLFLSPINSSIGVSQFGSTVFGLLDIRQSIFPIHVLSEVELKEQQSTDRKIDDTAWKSLLEEEENPVYNTLNRYFISREITEKNEYTGTFKGKNVIVIMLESVNNIVLHEEYFPNFKKILEHSWYFENAYSPRNACPTGDNEFSGMTSLFPINTACTVNTYPNNTYFEAIFNVFKRGGYHTTSYHDLDSHYYPRDIYEPNMGSENYYDGNRLGMIFDSDNLIEWPSDVELMQKASSILTQEKPFMAWITTVSAHQPYDYDSTLGSKYFSLFEDTDYSDMLKRYLSKLKVTDDSLGVLLKELESKNALKDTVIVMYGDHYPYGLLDKDISEMVDYDMSEFYERERVPFLIYQSELEPKVFSQNTYYMNILPTLFNLFDLEYDPRLYLGEDLFSSDFSGRVVFADGSWQDEIARYNAVDAKIEYLGSDTYTESEIQEINSEIYQKKEMSKLAISNDYFGYLEDALATQEEKLKEDKKVE